MGETMSLLNLGAATRRFVLNNQVRAIHAYSCGYKARCRSYRTKFSWMPDSVLAAGSLLGVCFLTPKVVSMYWPERVNRGFNGVKLAVMPVSADNADSNEFPESSNDSIS